jgi:ubiquinone/menaquinone biosynthesis C-methylase UbiE
MKKVVWATPLYKFLRECNSSPLEKTVLDCGAGGDDPPLQLFFDYGYETYGIEVAENPLKQAKDFCRKNGMRLNIFKGDMRRIPFKNESFNFVYSFNAIFFMTKEDVATSMKEIERILRPNGLCFVNFLSVDDPKRNTFCKSFLGSTGFSYHEDDEPDEYFRNFEILHKEKRITRKLWESKYLVHADIDYIARKMPTQRQHAKRDNCRRQRNQ